jgi:putative spermidine/putrescine transport system substrate-binding protein
MYEYGGIKSMKNRGGDNMYRKLTAAFLMSLAANGVSYARDLTIAGWGGSFNDAERVAFFAPFAKSKNLHVTEDTYLGGLAQIKTMVDTNNPKWDALTVESDDLQVGCDEGLFEPIDWKKYGNTSSLMPQAVTKCGVGAYTWATGIAYNRTNVGGKVPATWSDFWDTRTWPGKRGMRTGPKMNLEFALLADGVQPAKLYQVLSTPEGVDRAFAKLDKIKRNLQFWDAGAQPVDWLSAGNVVMSVAYSARIRNAVHDGKPLGFSWNNVQYAIDYWVIPKGAPNKDIALQFFALATSAEHQASYADKEGNGPTNVKASQFLKPDTLAGLPAGKNLENSFVIDDKFWTDNGDRLTERWNSWVAR